MADEEKVLILGTELTYKQRLFILAYLGEADFCGLDAARIAKYQGDDNTLTVIASENLRKPNIKSVIQQWLDIHAASVQEVLWRLGKMVRGDDSRDALKASELILKAYFAMGQSQDSAKLLNAPDMSAWVEKQSERVVEAEDTMTIFDGETATAEAAPLIIDVDQPEPEPEPPIYEWDEPGRELSDRETDVIADFSGTTKRRLHRR